VFFAFCLLVALVRLSVPMKLLTGKTRLQNDLLCAGRDVKPYSLSLTLDKGRPSQKAFSKLEVAKATFLSFITTLLVMFAV